MTVPRGRWLGYAVQHAPRRWLIISRNWLALEMGTSHVSQAPRRHSIRIQRGRKPWLTPPIGCPRLLERGRGLPSQEGLPPPSPGTAIHPFPSSSRAGLVPDPGHRQSLQTVTTSSRAGCGPCPPCCCHSHNKAKEGRAARSAAAECCLTRHFPNIISCGRHFKTPLPPPDRSSP